MYLVLCLKKTYYVSLSVLFYTFISCFFLVDARSFLLNI